ncbi:hypothetical protein [Lysobacter sp. CA196]|uniref:hypothetical protein n=1 Tax=Lysobacter sp. CA196 TaxID=3455606 RepID=UPI003F8D52A6
MRYIGHELRIDLNGDHRPNTVVLMAEDCGGYFAAVALSTPHEFLGTNAVFVHDRIHVRFVETQPGKPSECRVAYDERGAAGPGASRHAICRDLMERFRTGRCGCVPVRRVRLSWRRSSHIIPPFRFPPFPCGPTYRGAMASRIRHRRSTGADRQTKKSSLVFRQLSGTAADWTAQEIKTLASLKLTRARRPRD